MKYVSTRGSAPVLGFADVVLAGLANDGGLYVPETWPTLGPVTSGSYAELAASVFVPYVGADIDNATMQRLCDTAYSTFRHPDVVPVVSLEAGHHLMELFHGPTLAFKDVALQLLPFCILIKNYCQIRLSILYFSINVWRIQFFFFLKYLAQKRK